MKKAITTNEYRKQPLHTPRHWEPLTYIDGTPDRGYVLRILQSHLANCAARWEGTTNKKLAEQMNKFQEKRERLLKEAIAKLSS